MKKLLALILAVTMIGSLLLLTSCKNSDPNGTGENGGSENGGQNGKNQDDNAGGGSTPYQKDSVSSYDKLKAFGTSTGFYGMLEYDIAGETGFVECGIKGNVGWTSDSKGDGHLLVETGETSTAAYKYQMLEWAFDKNLLGEDRKGTDAVIQFDFGAYNCDFGYYAGYIEGVQYAFLKAGTETLFGRTCDKITYTNEFKTQTVNASIDQQLGILMKYDEVNSDTGFERHIKITDFKTGSAVTVPTYPEAPEDYTDYDGSLGWPSNSFSALVPEIPGNVSSSYLRRNEFSITAEETNNDAFTGYLSALEARGFTGEVTGPAYRPTYNGSDAAGNTVNVQLIADSTIVLTVNKAK